MNIGIASRLVKFFESECHRITPANEEEKVRCCWSVFILESAFTPGPAILQTDAMPLINMGYPPSPQEPGPPIDSRVSNLSPPPGSIRKDLGITAYCLQLVSIWGQITTYMRHLRSGQAEDSWLPASTYHKLTASFYQFETGLAQLHRFKHLGFHLRSPEEILQYKPYWTSWILLQVTFHTGQALLNHPLFHIPLSKTSSVALKPPSFLQYTVDQALIHSGWTSRLVRIAQDLGHQINDPFIGYLVVVAASIHWIFSFTSDENIAKRARSDFDQCREFVLHMASRWPQFSQTVSVHIKDEMLLIKILTGDPRSMC